MCTKSLCACVRRTSQAHTTEAAGFAARAIAFSSGRRRLSALRLRSHVRVKHMIYVFFFGRVHAATAKPQLDWFCVHASDVSMNENIRFQCQRITPDQNIVRRRLEPVFVLFKLETISIFVECS